MSDSPSSLTGILTSLRQLADGLLGSVHDRLELFTIELQEEKLAVIRILILINAAMFSALLALVFLSSLIVAWFWDTHRLLALGGFAALYGGAFAWIVIALKRYVAKMPRPFDATRHELEADREAFRPNS